MDATCAIQNSIHVFSLVHINMCPGFWVHISAMVGVSYRTIRAWEIDGRYPKQSSLYQKLADAFQCQVSYLMNDNETVCLGNDEPSEYSGAKQARQILEQAAALFASGTMTNEDKTIFMDEITRLYLE